MNDARGQWTKVGSRSRLEGLGRAVVTAGTHTLALFLTDGQLVAIDNRCPHMGFALSRGSIADGLLTCHWHHARFDLCSGGTLDPFADNVRTFPVRVDGDDVFVDLGGSDGSPEYWKRRLAEGMEQSLSLVLAKAVLALRAAGLAAAEIVSTGGKYGLLHRDAGWGSGMTILTSLANVLPVLDDSSAAQALTHGLVRLAADCAGMPPRFLAESLPTGALPPERLMAWFRRAVDVRDAEGAERVLQTCLITGEPPAAIDAALDMLYAAATDHYFIDGGHEIDFITKAAEYLDHAGSKQAPAALGSLVAGLCRADRGEEQYAWRYPIDLVSLVRGAVDQLPSSWERQRSGPAGLDELAAVLLADDPAASVGVLASELERGADVVELGRAVAYAAALRLARFPVSNEFGDWDTVHNTWSSCHALYRALQRRPSIALARGLFHAAMALYLDRFLNVPAARLPEERSSSGPAGSADELLTALGDAFDRQQQVDAAASIVHRYLVAGFPDGPLLTTIARLTLREDAGFHMYQTLEAGIRLYGSLREDSPAAARRVLVGVVRFLAAHAPTARALEQTVRIALRLHRGEDLSAEQIAG